MKTILVFLLYFIAAQAMHWDNSIFSSDFELDEHIIGGTEAEFGQFPYQAAIFLDTVAFCGGSLISETVVLTVAHYAEGTTDFTIHLGAQNITDLSEPGRIIMETRLSKIHPQFDSTNWNNDIALLYLSTPATGANIAPVRLPARSDVNNDFTDTPVLVSGWGKNADNGTEIPEEQLQYGETTVTSNDNCKIYYGDLIQTCHMCIDASTVGVCDGDIGGPVVMTEADVQYTLIGISSFRSVLGCETGVPQGASRLTCHLDWIEANADGVEIRP